MIRSTLAAAIVCLCAFVIGAAQAAGAGRGHGAGAIIGASSALHVSLPRVIEGFDADPKPGAPVRPGQKFVEFHGEFNYFPGNTSLIYGSLGANGKPAKYTYVSFEPAGGIIGLIVGSIIPLPSTFSGYSWDRANPPATKYRVLLTEEEYKRLDAFINHARKTRKVFWLYTENCVRLVRDAARVIGLKAPENTFVLPPTYVNMLSWYNRGRLADPGQSPE